MPSSDSTHILCGLTDRLPHLSHDPPPDRPRRRSLPGADPASIGSALVLPGLEAVEQYARDMPLTGGDRFAGFTVIRMLGAGGMGEVYEAQHPRLPRRDALKLLRSDISADPDYRSRFAREADLASTLWHPHIVGFHDRGEFDGQLWISMDYVDGLNAAQLMADRYPAGMPVELVIEIVSAVAGALDYAHKKGLLHRDVKPANIMMTSAEDDQRILLADFGIARNLDEVNGLTTTNMTVGTVAYAAPEQLMGDALDGRADQYALAASAYHLLTGEQLFPHSNPAAVISRHLTTPPPSLGNARSSLGTMDAAFAVALAKNPNDRFTRCVDFANAMAVNAQSPAAAAAASARTKSAPVAGKPARDLQPDPNWSRGWTILASVSAIVIVVGMVLLIWRPWRPGTAETTVSDSFTPSTSSPSPASTRDRPPPLPPPPAPRTYPAANIDSLLLSPADVYQLTNGEFEGQTPGSPLDMINSTLGLSDNSFAVDPQRCSGVLFGAEQRVFADTGYEAIRNQTLGKGTYSLDKLVEETAAVFGSTEQAQAVLTASTAQWRECSAGHPTQYESESSVDQDAGYERGYGWYLGDVQDSGEMVTVRMSAVNNENGEAPACQMAMGINANVVVKTKTCLETNSNPSRPPSSLAGDYAEQMATAMLRRVQA